MLKKVATLLSIVMAMEAFAITPFAATGDTHTVKFEDKGLSGYFAQGTACGEDGQGYGTTENRDGKLYVTVTDLISSDEITEGQYYLGAPNAIPYDPLTEQEKEFLTKYKGYRYRTSEEDEDGNITYTYFAFRGWLVSSSGEGQTRNGEIVPPGEQIMISADTTLTAQWGIDSNRNGVADVDEGDFTVLYLVGSSSDGSDKYVLTDGSLPPSYTVDSGITTQFQPYYEIKSYNDSGDDSYSTGIKEIGAEYEPKIDPDWAKENDVHKCFVGWSYDTTSVGQDKSTVSQAPAEDNSDTTLFDSIVSDLYTKYYSKRLYTDNSDAIDKALSGDDDEYDKLIESLEEEYYAMAKAEASEWFATPQTVYNLQPGTTGFIPVREWDNEKGHYVYLLPAYVTNTNLVLTAVWADDMNDNDVPDEDESHFRVEYKNTDVGYTGTLPTDDGDYLAGDTFTVAEPGGKVNGKVFMGWVDTYWDSQYLLAQNPDMEHYGYAGKYPNKFHLYVSANDRSWAEEFENKYSYLDGESIVEEKGKAVVSDGTVPHNYEEEQAGKTFPVYDEDGSVIDISYLKNTVPTGESQGVITLTAWWEDDTNNNNIPDIIEPQSRVEFTFAKDEYLDSDKPVDEIGGTDMLRNLDPEEDAELIEAYKSGEKLVELTGVPADMTAFTGAWVTIPKDDQVLGTDYYYPALSDEDRGNLKLIFKDWLYVSRRTGHTVEPRAIAMSADDGIQLTSLDIDSDGAPKGTTIQNRSAATQEIVSQKTELNPGDIFKLSEDVYMVAVWYDDVNENDIADQLETKYSVTYTSGTSSNVTNLPPTETDILSGTEVSVQEAIPYRAGYSFTGWKSSVDGNIYRADQTFEMPESNVVLEATWANTTYLLTYLDANGQLATAYNYAAGQEIALLKLDDYTGTDKNSEGKDTTYNYIFTGWQDLATGQVYSSSYQMPATNVTLQAYYVKVEAGEDVPVYYRVTYNANTDDTVTDIPVDVTAYSYNSSVIISYTIPVRAGYIFKGWEYGGKVYTPGQFFTITENATLNAVWEEDKNASGSGSATESTTSDTSTDESSTESTTDDTTTTDDSTTESTTDESSEESSQGTPGTTGKSFITGNAKENILHKDFDTVVKYDDSTFGYALSSYGTSISTSVPAAYTIADLGNSRASSTLDKFKLVTEQAGIRPTEGQKMLMLGLFDNNILGELDGPVVGMTWEQVHRGSLFNQYDLSEDNVLVVFDTLPLINADMFDYYLDSDASVAVGYSSDPFAIGTDFNVVGRLDLSDLDYNLVTIDGVDYMTPLWQSIVCDMSGLEVGDEPAFTISLEIPNYKGYTKPSLNCFRLGIDNMRIGTGTIGGEDEPTSEPTSSESTSSESSIPSEPSEPSEDVIDIGMSSVDVIFGTKSTYPSSITTQYKTYGVTLSSYILGNVSTLSPTVTVYDESTGSKLSDGVDYTVSYDTTGSNNSTSPYYMIIKGLGNYKGYVILPFIYSGSSSSSSGGSSSGSSSGKVSSGGGGGRSYSIGTTSTEKPKSYQVVYAIGDLGTLSSEDKNYSEKDVKDGNYITTETTGKVTLPEVEPTGEYKFAGWGTTEKASILVNKTFEVSENTILYAIYNDEDGDAVDVNYGDAENAITTTEETTETTSSGFSQEVPSTPEPTDDVITHNSYISGYTDGTFRPSASITRAEACTILAKALGLTTGYSSNSFSDVSSSDWFAGSVDAIKNSGITSGYSDGTFRPNNPITRAEFVTLIAKAKGLSGSYCSFSDVSGSWAYNYICGVTNEGWVSGYNDGTFHPDESITRAEVVVIVNKMLGRTPDSKYIAASYENLFSDVESSYWGFDQIFEACRTHYVKKSNYSTSAETWVGHD